MGIKSKRVIEKVDDLQINEESVKEFTKFFKIDLKSEADMNKMTKKEQRQYECRLKRWTSLVDTHVQYEIYKIMEMLKNLDRMFVVANEKMAEIRADPDAKNDKNYKKMLSDTEKMKKQLASDRQAFEDIYIPYKKRKAEELLEIKAEDNDMYDNEMEDKEELDREVKDEYFSDDSSDDIKLEAKEEYISEEDSLQSNGAHFSVKEEAVDDKSLVKKEIKTEVKSEIKSEIKNEVKTEDSDHSFTRQIKKEYLSSDDSD